MSSNPELFVGGESMPVGGDLVGAERVCEYRSRKLLAQRVKNLAWTSEFLKIRFENGGKPDVSRVLPLRRVLTATQKLGVTLPIFWAFKWVSVSILQFAGAWHSLKWELRQ